MMRKQQAGFTMIELVVVGALFIGLAIGASLLVHPRNYEAANRNTDRRLDMALLLRAIRAYQADKGELPPNIDTKDKLVGSASDGVDLCKALVPDYIQGIPRDPLLKNPPVITKCGDYVTGFAIAKSADGQHVRLFATLSEAGDKVGVND